jgi:hypothetical protein
MAQPPRNIGMKQTIDPRIAANVTQRIVEAMTESLCASTPMLSWHGPRTDGDGMISAGGSAFLIRTQTGVFGVTAGHVVDGFIAARSTCRGLTATLGGFSFDLEGCLLGRGCRADIATFRVREADLPTIGFRPLERAWPPATPASNGIVLLAGWPGHERVVGTERVTGGIYIGWGSAGVSDLQITIRADHDRGLFSPLPGVPLPPPGFDFGGISGGPVMVIDAEDDGFRIGWRLAGVISEGKPDYDYIVATRADIIQSDGQIRG